MYLYFCLVIFESAFATMAEVEGDILRVSLSERVDSFKQVIADRSHKIENQLNELRGHSESLKEKLHSQNTVLGELLKGTQTYFIDVIYNIHLAKYIICHIIWNPFHLNKLSFWGYCKYTNLHVYIYSVRILLC